MDWKIPLICWEVTTGSECPLQHASLLEYCVHTAGAGFDLKTIEKICGGFLWSGPDMVKNKGNVAWKEICCPLK